MLLLKFFDKINFLSRLLLKWCPAHHYSNSQNLVISFEYSWFLAKILANFVSLPWKLHNRKCHIVQGVGVFLCWPFLDKFIQNRSLWKQRVVNFLVLRSELLDGPGLNENYDLIIDALFGFLVHALVHSITSEVEFWGEG